MMKSNKNIMGRPEIKALLDLGKDFNCPTDSWFRKMHRVDPHDKIQGKASILEDRLIKAEKCGEIFEPIKYSKVAMLFGDSHKISG